MEESGGQEESTAPPGSYFAPDTRMRREHTPFGGRITWWRLALRFLLLACALYAVDVVVARTLQPDSTYAHSYRLPAILPTASLVGYVDSLHASSLSRKGGPIIAFVGASPTWGHRIKDASNTYPYAFQSAALAAGWPSRTFNLACNGQFFSDEYFIARRVTDDADVVFVQLTYHSFNPAARAGAVMRYPELPQLLGLNLDATEAALLGRKPPAAGTALSQASTTVGRHWLLWRERDSLDRRLFGGKPAALLGNVGRGMPAATRLSTDTAPTDDGFSSFEQLEPGQQMIVIAGYAENASFTVGPNDSDVRFVALLAQSLAAKGKKAVFFMAPLNRQLIDDYQLIDPRQYEANVGVLRAPIETAGFRLLDYNNGPEALPIEYFADISHTNDEGGKAVGARLYRDTWEYLEAKRP